MRLFTLLRSLIIILLYAPMVHAASYNFSFTKIDIPGSSSVSVNGINNLGTIVGVYGTRDGYKSFMMSGGIPQDISVGWARGINDLGQVVGDTFGNSEFPGATEEGINNAGSIVGGYSSLGSTHAFILKNGVYENIDVEGAIYSNAYGLNNFEHIAGITDFGSGYRGFLRIGDDVTILSVPGFRDTIASDVNDHGLVIGWGEGFGWLWDGVDYTVFQFPSSGGTEAKAINNMGQIVGTYYDLAAGRWSGFIATILPVLQLSCVGFEYPMDNTFILTGSKKGRVFPLKISLYNNDVLVTDNDLLIPPSYELAYSKNIDNTILPSRTMPQGIYDEGNQFLFRNGKWELNLPVSMVSASGTYTIRVVSGDLEEYRINPLCKTTFIIPAKGGKGKP